LVALFMDGGRVIAELATPRGPAYYGTMILSDGVLGLDKLSDYCIRVPRGRAGMLPDGIITEGHKGIAESWLTDLTRRYDHGVLGDAVEAAGVRARGRDGRVLSFMPPSGSVFEDRRVRLADLSSGDDGDELLVVQA